MAWLPLIILHVVVASEKNTNILNEKRLRRKERKTGRKRLSHAETLTQQAAMCVA